MSNYFCESCNISQFKTKQAYERHMKSLKHTQSTREDKIKYNCHCGKWFSHRSGLSFHKKKCTGTPTPTPTPAPIPPPPSLDIAAIKLEMENAIKAQFEKFQSVLEKNRPPTKHTTKRVQICKKLRARIIEKQDNKCNKCSNPFSPFNIHIDHIVGIQFGGSNDEDNLQALCLECHHAKTIKETKYRKKIKDTINQVLEELSTI